MVLSKLSKRHNDIISAKFVDDEILESEYVNSDTKKNIGKYFDGKLLDFPNKIKLNGTPFQLKVWRCIINIPYGSTKTYKEIAQEIGNPNAYRAVANACGKNNIALFVPCHRVIGKNNIGGYKWGKNKKKMVTKSRSK